MGTERGGCSRLMKTPRHNGGAVHSRSMRAKKKDNHCSGRPCDKSRGGRCDKKRELTETLFSPETREYSTMILSKEKGHPLRADVRCKSCQT